MHPQDMDVFGGNHIEDVICYSTIFIDSHCRLCMHALTVFVAHIVDSLNGFPSLNGETCQAVAAARSPFDLSLLQQNR